MQGSDILGGVQLLGLAAPCVLQSAATWRCQGLQGHSAGAQAQHTV